MSRPIKQPKRRIQIRKPAIQNVADDHLWQDVRKLSDLIPSEPEPNMGRVQEIKEALKRGTYPTPEMIDEVAARLAGRFTRNREGNP